MFNIKLILRLHKSDYRNTNVFCIAYGFRTFAQNNKYKIIQFLTLIQNKKISMDGRIQSRTNYKFPDQNDQKNILSIYIFFKLNVSTIRLDMTIFAGQRVRAVKYS